MLVPVRRGILINASADLREEAELVCDGIACGAVLYPDAKQSGADAVE